MWLIILGLLLLFTAVNSFLLKKSSIISGKMRGKLERGNKHKSALRASTPENASGKVEKKKNYKVANMNLISCKCGNCFICRTSRRSHGGSCPCSLCVSESAGHNDDCSCLTCSISR